MDGDGLGEIASENPDDELAVRKTGLNTAAKAVGELDLTFVSAVLPFVDEIGPRTGASKRSMKAQLAGLNLNRHVVGGDRGQWGDDN
jgi:hypothetical protein